MWMLGVVVTTPDFDRDLRLLQCVKDFAVEQLVAQFAIEAFAIAIFPRVPSFDASCLGTNCSDPL
jgi:hypothetical protein